ncbi:hypothetical protein BON30_28875 [Cystobacter ferrugineus]|uniref:Uncharacterized protein n=1 Tax=Cystobacter ferrugineus TaxID=83449 RepID=A0A1L9B4Y2_9BACT|nr:hypothetical protein BON30_28875 [Cystobacter ferrugineus]
MLGTRKETLAAELKVVLNCLASTVRSRRSESAGTMATVDNPVPLECWQSRQWQLSTAMGAAEPS